MSILSEKALVRFLDVGAEILWLFFAVVTF